MFFRKLLTPAVTAVAIMVSTAIPATDLSAPETTTVFLVRHAEKTADSHDPGLSAAGQRRARQLASILRDAQITHIYSTDYARTRDTAAPLTKMLKLDLEFYDPQKLAQFADVLSSLPGRHLVVGHSNTTPELVALLGGDPGMEIDESAEYDRLYVVTIFEGAATSLLMRYGESFRSPDSE